MADSSSYVPYQLGLFKWFWMPTEQGRIIRAIAIPTQQSNIWIAAYTLLLILIFVALGRIVKDLVIAIFPLRGNGNRHAMLVGYYNTNDPVSIIMLAGSYCWKTVLHVKGDGMWGIDWNTFWLGIFLIGLSLSLLGANAVGGLLVARNLRLGSVALVRPESVFIPPVFGDDINVNFQLNQLVKGPAAFRSVANFDQLASTLKDKFTFNSAFDRTDPDRPGFSLNYTYEVSGYDFGLQRAPELLYKVRGACRTQYDWIGPQVTGTGDNYTFWNDPNQFITLNRTKEELSVPWAEFIPELLESDADDYPASSRFVILPHTVYRRSITPNDLDPWYLSEPFSDPTNLTQYRVRAERPPLLCEQWDTWEFRGNKKTNVYYLEDLVKQNKDLHLSKLFWNTLFLIEFATPTLAVVGNSLGTSSLSSSLQNIAVNQVVDLGRQSIETDLYRLVVASLIYAREVVRTTARSTAEMRENLPNSVEQTNLTMKEVADFVLSDTEIATMSVKILIATPAVCLVFWIIIWLRGTCIFTGFWGGVKNDSYRTRYIQRTICFSAIQLYRYLDEEMSGERRWAGRLSFYPYIKDVRGKYMRRYSDFEVIPTSARNSSPMPSPSPTPHPESREPYKDSNTIEDEELGTITPYGDSFSPTPDGDRASTPSNGANDSTRSLVTPFVRPALVPLHERRSSAPVYNSQTGNVSLGTRPVSFSAQTRHSTAQYAPRDDTYELVLTRHWRPSLRRDNQVYWSQVARE
jgi:hypothetical protein